MESTASNLVESGSTLASIEAPATAHDNTVGFAPSDDQVGNSELHTRGTSEEPTGLLCVNAGKFEDVSLSDRTEEEDEEDSVDNTLVEDIDTTDINIMAGSDCAKTQETRAPHSPRPLSVASTSSIDNENNSTTGTSTPLGTPISSSQENLMALPADQKQVLEDMQLQNRFILSLQAIEKKYEARLIDMQSEKTKLQQQIDETNDKMQAQQETFDRMVMEVKSSLTAKLESAKKQATISRKDLESMVIKYATSEQQVITARKTKEEAEKKMRDALKDKESLNARIRGLSADKASLTSSFEKKVAENVVLNKDLDRMKREMLDRDQKWKHTQSELKIEAEQHSETKRRLDEALSELGRIRTEIDELRVKVNESSNEDALADGEPGDKASPFEQLQSDIDLYKKKWTDLAEENHGVNVKLQSLEKNRLEHEQTIRKLKDNANELESELADCNSRLTVIDQLKATIESDREMRQTIEREVERLKIANADLLSEMELCRQKEGELLEFTERATSKTVSLQSEHNYLEQKCAQLQEHSDSLQSQFDVLTAERDQARRELICSKGSFEKVKLELERTVNEQNAKVLQLKRKIDELENENRVMKKRHFSSMKELKKELSTMRKKMDNLDTQSAMQGSIADGLSIGSRTSSSTSLDVLGSSSQQHVTTPSAAASQTSSTHADSLPANNGHHSSPPSSSTPSSMIKVNALPELDKQMLVDRIIRLQKNLAKRSEKIDFLEEHNHQLIEEMKKKTKLVQYFIIREESGALATNSMDDNKKLLAKKGSTIMSSIYQTATPEANMTMDLSIEINRKLQAVLEDTILKNIMLKESLSTLGEEIARLSKPKQKQMPP